MAIIKTKIRERNYVQIDKTGINDKRLSWAATGLLTYLIERPENWNIIIEHLKTVKTNGRDSTRNALNNLREFNYCHYFEIREKGKIIETIYLIFENPISPKEAEKEIEVLEGQQIYYKEYKPAKKVVNKEVQPETGNPFSAIPFPENPTLLIKEYTKERNTNNRTTTKDIKTEYKQEEKDSSNYDFLDKNIFNLLNNATKKNIRKNIKDLTEEKFAEIYNLTLECIKQGKGQNFNAVLYKGLNDEWEYTANIKTEEPKLLDENKRKWLSYFAGIISDKNLKNEIENIIINIPIEILNTNKNTLARMNTFEFKQHLLCLRRKC